MGARLERMNIYRWLLSSRAVNCSGPATPLGEGWAQFVRPRVQGLLHMRPRFLDDKEQRCAQWATQA